MRHHCTNVSRPGFVDPVVTPLAVKHRYSSRLMWRVLECCKGHGRTGHEGANVPSWRSCVQRQIVHVDLKRNATRAEAQLV